MATAQIKLNSANFDYYLLKVNPNIGLDKIASKLATLRNFDPTAKYLALEINSPVSDLKNFQIMLSSIVDLSHKNLLEVKFIQKSEFATEQFYGHLPVVDLPATIRGEPVLNQTLLVEQPIRSGIKIENDGDVIVKALVSNNAEIIAAGNIHVYGDCRGRVLAGVQGNKKARIFVTRFNAELISIGGIFRVIEDKLPASILNKTVEVFLDDKERLNIVPLGE